MKTKILSILSLSILSLIVLSSIIIASPFTTNPTSLNYQTSSAQTITITNPTPSTPINIDFPSTITIQGEDGYSVVFDVTGQKTGITSTSSIIVDPQTTIDFSKFDLGVDSYTANLVINSDIDSKTVLVEITSNNYCESANPGELDLNIDGISVNGFSEDDNEWYPTDEVEIEVQVDNNGDEDIDNIEIEWCLYDNENKNCVIEETESDIDVKDGDDETVTFTFTVDPDDLESDVTDYTLYVRATGEVADGTFEGDDSCASDSEDIEMMLSDDFVVLSNIKVEPASVSCGNQATITADVWNIGNDDQDDVSVELRLTDPALKISKTETLDSVDAFDKEDVSFTVEVPKGTAEKTYNINLLVTDEDGDVFENDDDTKSTFTTQLKVEGNCGPEVIETKVIVSPVLESGGKAGEQLVVKVGVTNSGTTSSTFNIDVSGFDDWASGDYAPKTLTLNAGQSGDFKVTLTPNQDAVGKQTFSTEIQAQGSTTPVRKTVELDITKASGGIKFPGITGGVSGIINKNNWYLWGIGLLNLLLVIVIIVVAVRIARS